MIYIDPPYNTGSDGFVYEDDRKFTPNLLSELSGVGLEEAERILEFTHKKSNSHSAWLTFMYPRLFIARELLREDGVIFIYIDDNEQAQLKLLCDEIFGEENFVACLPWKGRGGGADDKNLLQNHEYVLMYAKKLGNFATGRKIKTGEKFPKFDEEKQRYYKTQLVRKWGSNSKRQDRPNLYYSVFDYKRNEVFPILPNGEAGCWRWKKERLELAIKNKDVEFLKRGDGAIEIYEKIYEPLEGEYRTKLYSAWLQDEVLDELGDLLQENDCKNTAFGTKQLKELFLQGIFDYPKPTTLISVLNKIAGTEQNSLILDFFAGSGTTAHAVMQLNAEDNGNRKFILVQLPEKTDPKSEANKAGYQTIFDITKARIEKAAEKIKSENPEYKGDLGFKIFETAPDFRKLTDFNEDIDIVRSGQRTDLQHHIYDTVTDPDSDLTSQQIHTLLTTWRVYDGQPLTDPVVNVDLNGYTAYLCSENIYILNHGFENIHIRSILDKLDNDKDFVVGRIFVYGDAVSSARLQELKQAIKDYKNRKSLEINLSIRY